MRCLAAITALGLIASVNAEPPDIEYIYPAGAQRGTTVPVRVGGYYFHGQANFEMLGKGVKFQSTAKITKTIWFEGPLVHQPLSQQAEAYPKDHLTQITVAKNAELGHRLWRCWTSQGATKTLKFVIGDLPEVMENEMNGRPIPQLVNLPVTANGRIFPREDVDIWTFNAKAGEIIVCDAAAKRFDSPLKVVLAVRDPKGNPVATQKTLRKGDPIHWFKAYHDGLYQIHIHDAKFWGLQNHIYRLTIKRGPHILHHFPLGAQRGTKVTVELNGPNLSNKKVEISLKEAKGQHHLAAIKNWGTASFVISNHPELIEPRKSTAIPPIVFNGRIAKPGEIDAWQIKIEENQKITLDIAAAQRGSPLDAVLSIHDAEGKQLTTNDDRAKGQPDPLLDFTAKTAGVYEIRIRDRFNSRGGLAFVYRLTAEEPVEAKPGFEISLNQNFLNLTRPSKPHKNDAKPTGPKLKVSVKRTGDFKGEVKLNIAGLPANVKVHNDIIAANKKDTSLQFTLTPKTKIALHRLTIEGTANISDKNVARTAVVPSNLDHLLLSIAPSVPFKHEGIYRIISAMPGGSTYYRAYKLNRGGFDGPLTVRLSDKQIRHLQGVTDRVIEVPAGADEFKYPYNFPARVEVGRTSRLQVMLVGELTDFDGTKHKISYTSNARNDQLISIAAEGLVAVQTSADSFTAKPNTEIIIPVTIRRGPAVMKQPMKIELLQPNHAEGMIAESVELEPGQTKAVLKIQTANSLGPFNAPFKIRASTTQGPRHVAEKEVDFVAQSR